jgi:hypothetical protein
MVFFFASLSVRRYSPPPPLKIVRQTTVCYPIKIIGITYNMKEGEIWLDGITQESSRRRRKNPLHFHSSSRLPSNIPRFSFIFQHVSGLLYQAYPFILILILASAAAVWHLTFFFHSTSLLTILCYVH